jgi:transcriptional regulator with XRE-family HTH domain
MTQGAVGAKLDPQHTRKNVCKWEHGQTEPSLATVEQLAKVLNVTPCWLAFGDIHRAQ